MLRAGRDRVLQRQLEVGRRIRVEATDRREQLHVAALLLLDFHGLTQPVRNAKRAAPICTTSSLFSSRSLTFSAFTRVPCFVSKSVIT